MPSPKEIANNCTQVKLPFLGNVSTAVPETEHIEIYHDEVQSTATHLPFGHQFLVVPTRSKASFHQLLMETRDRFRPQDDNVYRTINWKNIRERDFRTTAVATNWLELLVSATHLSRVFKSNGSSLHPQGVKISSIFIKSRDEMADHYWQNHGDGERNNLKFETLLRIGLKGALHYLYNPDYTPYRKVVLKGLYTDGKPLSRPLDTGRIIDRVRPELRDYVEIPDSLTMDAVSKSKNKSAKVNFLELTDLILGATYFTCGDQQIDWKQQIARPVSRLYAKRQRGSGFQHSGHFRSFSVSWASINKQGEWEFQPWQEKEWQSAKQGKLLRSI